ncbi:unnamed protein product [Polarella glacialis]|uniref:Serine protease n=1 Tax=Polarella glacialis TaxID=89957 RepID=A0A813HY85_POLGL|nr:unnamed protein product [Polarella glacialis]CAE8732338.1 unnamed protein product [Polarella glacialis]
MASSLCNVRLAVSCATAAGLLRLSDRRSHVAPGLWMQTAPKQSEDHMKFAKLRKPVVPQGGGGCFHSDEEKLIRAVCCLTKSNGAQSTGVLVRFAVFGQENVGVLTCNHVLASKESEIPACRFLDNVGAESEGVGAEGFVLRIDLLFVTNKKLDYTLVGIDTSGETAPEPILLTLPRRRVFAGVALRMVGFPRRMPLRCMYGVVTEPTANKFRSTCAHEPGMSGAALFVDGELVGIHTGFFQSTDDASHTYVGAILSDISRSLKSVHSTNLSTAITEETSSSPIQNEK